MIFDSHCHLLLIEEKGKTLPSIIENSINNNIRFLLDVSVGLNDFFKRLSKIREINKKYDIFINMSAGIPPYFADKRQKNDISKLHQQVTTDKLIVAIGEIGLDYYYDYGTHKMQKDLLVEQIDLANILNLPIIIHTRDSDKDLIEILKLYNPERGGVIHCFSSDYPVAKSLLDLGFYISFSGNITYKKSYKIQETASKIPINRILIETDSPYLAPQKYRGKINEPSFIVETASCIAELRNTDFQNICNQTTKNAKRLFNIF